MKVDRDELAARFRELCDEELLERAGSRALTELAQEVAVAELQARGLRLPASAAPPLEPAPAPGELSVCGVFLHPIAAEALKVRLMAEGLSAVTHYANGGVFGNVGDAGVRVLVPQSQLADAERIRAAMEAGDYAIDENFDPDR
jgi:hypothetical protein